MVISSTISQKRSYGE